MNTKLLLRVSGLALVAMAASQAVPVRATGISPSVVSSPASGNNLAALTAEECYAMTKVTLTGDVSEEDYVAIRDRMFNVTQIDMSAANVRSLPPYAFAGMYKLRTVNLPEGLKEIGDAAFLSCHDLTTVNIPEGVIRVGALAFSRTAVSTISLPASLTELGKDALFFCRSLRVITVADGNNAYTTVGGALFTADKTRLIKRAPLQAGRAIVLPPELKSVDAHACAGCKIMSTPDFPDGLETIGDYAFAFCPGMQDPIVLPSSVKVIGEGAFFYASSAPRTVKIPAGVTAIGARAFAYMDAVTKVELPSTLRTIGPSAFECNNKISVISCETIVPPLVNGLFSFRNVDRNATFVDVPAESMAAYKAAPVWKEFQNYDGLEASDYELYGKDGKYFIRYDGDGDANGKYLRFNFTDNQPADLVAAEEEASQWDLEFFTVAASVFPFAGNPGADIRYYTGDRVHHINFQGLCWNDPAQGYGVNNNRTFGFYMKNLDYGVNQGPLTAIVGNGTVWGANADGTQLAASTFTGKYPASSNFVWRIEPVEKVEEPDPEVGLVGVMTSASAVAARWFDLNGRAVANPSHGLFIRVDANGKASKVKF